MKQNRERIWVHPDFKKSIKIMAIEQGKDVMALTKMAARSEDDFKEFIRKMRLRCK